MLEHVIVGHAVLAQLTIFAAVNDHGHVVFAEPDLQNEKMSNQIGKR